MNDPPRFLDEPVPPAQVVRPLAEEPAERGWVEGVYGREGPVTHATTAALNDVKLARPRSPLAIGVVALLILILGLFVLDLARFIAGQFAVAAWLGLATTGLVVGTGSVMGWSLLREWRGYAALGRVDHLRKGFQSEDVAVVRRVAEDWLVAIGEGPAALKVVAAAPNTATLRALLRSGPLSRLDQGTTEAGRVAALEVLAATAVSPWPGLDGAIAAWRGFRLVMHVAQLHGLRPRTIGTLRLFRRVTLDAAGVAAADIAVSALTEALFSSPLGGALAGQATGSAVAARRMLRLAFATAKSCRPI